MEMIQRKYLMKYLVNNNDLFVDNYLKLYPL